MVEQPQSRWENCWLSNIHGIPLLSFVLTHLALASCYHACTQQDRNSLFSFWLDLSAPTSLNWTSIQDPSSDCCQWQGISCDSSGRVASLWLPQKGLTGHIPLSVGNLTNLHQLNLSHNRLLGAIHPQLFVSLINLEVLDLSFNDLSGELPPISSALRVLDISSNFFTREFPPLVQISNLSALNISNNSFSGAIPTTAICGNSSLLKVLDLSRNKFSGEIPYGLGNCSNLETLRAGINFLSGPLPTDIYTLGALHQISLPFNEISGMLVDELIANLKSLTILEINNNVLSGPIPRSIGSLASLEQLLIHYNNLSGSLPLSFSNCINLISINLRNNSLTGDISPISFSNFSQLETIDLGNNNFTGMLPVSLYFCKSLVAVRLAANSLQGEIQPDILGLQNLSYLSISNNNLTNILGAMQILKDCKNLSAILLSKNFMGESMPQDINIISGGFRNVRVLALADCQLTGQIPPWLANLGQLQALDLSINRLTGPIPTWLGTFPNLFYLDLSSNLLKGELPPDISQLSTLTSPKPAAEQDYLRLPVFVKNHNRTSSLLYNQLSDLPPAIYVRNNSLSGVVPPEIGHLQVLHVLDLSHNKFSGGIPEQLSNLTNLEQLDLSANNFSGIIPQSLKHLNFLAFFSVAQNNLQGLIPSGGQFDTFPASSFEGNPRLCGLILLQPCNETSQGVVPARTPNKKLIVGIILGICFGGSIVLAVLAWSVLSKRRIKPNVSIYNSNINSDSLSAGNHHLDPDFVKDSSLVLLGPAKYYHQDFKGLTIFDIVRATDNFDQAKIIGCGGFGLVYKATLPNGTIVAIKKLSGDLGLMEREFKAEVEALSNAQHKNLVSLLAYCVHGGAHMLIYSYLENGSLDYWLHEKTNGPTQLDWSIRLRIARGASRGLSHLHQTCEPHIVHRDIKSSNILLDEKFEAYVADFGLSRLILPYRTHVTTELVGTLGYIPPEYGQAWIATLRGDVYSFGVVMLELLTGRRAVEVFKPKQSRELVSWVQQMRIQGKQDQIFDNLLHGNGFEQQMVQMLDVACMCVNKNPLTRPTIDEVVSGLEKIGAEQIGTVTSENIK